MGGGAVLSALGGLLERWESTAEGAEDSEDQQFRAGNMLSAYSSERLTY